MTDKPPRRPAVAGSFYPKAEREARAQLDRCYEGAEGGLLPAGRGRAVAAVIPHAGWVYSGGVAAKVYARLALPETTIVLCPNHTGVGARLALWPDGAWLSPLGAIPVDDDLARLLLAECPDLEPDALAHRGEHAVEVHVPFLLRERPGARLVPIVVGTHDERLLASLGEGIARAVRACGKDVLIVSSSDLNHYEDHETTLVKDKLAIDKVLALDAPGLLEVCTREEISMCGLAPTYAAIEAAKRLGAKEALLVDHKTSGDVSGDFDRVVGYAGMLVR